MANEFVVRKGLIVSGSQQNTGSFTVSGSVIANAVTASFFKGDGSQLTNLPSSAIGFNIDAYEFVGTGTQTTFDIVNSYNINSLIVTVDGLTFNPVEDYTLSSNNLQFVQAPPSESIVLVRVFVNATENVTGSFSGSFLGNISNAVSSSYALTASFALNGGGGGALPSGVVSSSIQVDHNATTNYVANQHIDHSTVSISPGSGLSGGGTIAATRTLTLDTSSAHFTNGVKTKLNLDGVFSSSAQVSFTAISNRPAGLVSASSQVSYTGLSNVPSGILSSSTQINALSGVSSSFATTASFALGGGSPTFPFTGSAIITGSFIVSSSENFPVTITSNTGRSNIIFGTPALLTLPVIALRSGSADLLTLGAIEGVSSVEAKSGNSLNLVVGSNTWAISATDGAFRPLSNNVLDIGSSTNRVKTGYFTTVSASAVTASVSGNLTGIATSASFASSQEIAFSIPNTLTVGTGVSRWYITRDVTITNIVATVSTAPAGASVIFDVNKNGTTVFTTQGNRPTVAATTFTDLNSIPDVISLTSGDYLTVDVDQIGSSVAGADAVIRINVI
jgi:hypothetical protein